jgi:Skp family chaperone for outer membrane proteins
LSTSVITRPAIRRAAILATAAMLVWSGTASAQGYFIPPQAAAPRAASPAPVARPAPRPAAPVPQALPPPPPVQLPAGMAGVAGTDTVDAGTDAAAQAQMPNIPVPDLPALPKGATPPAAVIGVLGVPEIMHAATAAQQVEKVIAERREKLNQDAQKEQAVWRQLQEQLGAQRATLPPDQVRQKERELQERITASQNSFRDRNRIIQETAQYSLSQIERTLIGVIRQVAESRGMNLVLHRAQVALNVNEFDITEQVTQQMNKVMPTINMPADGVSPLVQAKAGATPASGAPATPASAPPSPPPARR